MTDWSGPSMGKSAQKIIEENTGQTQAPSTVSDLSSENSYQDIFAAWFHFETREEISQPGLPFLLSSDTEKTLWDFTEPSSDAQEDMEDDLPCSACMDDRFADIFSDIEEELSELADFRDAGKRFAALSEDRAGPDRFYEKFSRILGMKLDGTEDPELLAAIDEWLGTPYRLGGCSKNGIDCSCLVKNIYEEVYGIRLTRTSREIFAELTPVKKTDLQEGDILCFANRKRISHVGIYLKDGKFVHASRKHGVIISSLSENYYQKRFAGAGRIPGPAAVSLSKLIRTGTGGL
ncbi:MAG: C40 family peptidase [Desulfobacterales bacterium]